MQREALFEIWAPTDGVWSLWARPVLFAQMPVREDPTDEEWLTFPVDWAPPAAEGAVLVVDLPGEEAVWTGLALAGHGYRPVPLFNACTGSNEVVDQQQIIRGLRAGGPYLAERPLADAPPAFLLDALRMSPTRKAGPGDFDNRWQVFPQDFPSAAYLKARGLIWAVLVQRGRKKPQEDLAHVLRRWQDAGIVLAAVDVAAPGPPTQIGVAQPRWYRSVWQRVQALVGLRPSLWGGFGGRVPQPSQG